MKKFKKITQKVEPKIKEILADGVDKKTKPLVFYQIESGGKRLRPVLAVISCFCCGGKMKDILYPAAGLEILHNYTLIIDDIIDNSIFRRGKPTVWKKFGSSIAQCLGVDYAASVFQAAARSRESKKISELFAKTMKQIAEGEILDILFEQAGRQKEPFVLKNRFRKISQKDYFEMAGRKTALLLAACCQIGGIAANAGKKEINALKTYGYNLGLAFQIQDDILDIFGGKEFGKKIGKDIEERKLGNIVILYALTELSPKKRKKLLAIFKKEKIDKNNILVAIDLIKETAAREKALQLGRVFCQKAKASLGVLPKNSWNTTLQDIADFVIERNK
jgi:geranylgeranyl diphosphate synthase type I